MKSILPTGRGWRLARLVRPTREQGNETPSLARRANHRTNRRRARAAIAIFPVAFALVVAGIWTTTEVVRPEVCDPDYLARRDLLRRRLEERPRDRLAVVLGSSRTGLGFVPEALPQNDGTLWFNLSHFASGPVFLLVTLDRMERDGIRPDVVVIELMPAFLVHEHPRLVGMHLSALEVMATAEYGDGGLRGWYYLRHRLVPGNLKQAFDPVGMIRSPRPYGGPPVLYDTMNPVVRANLSRIEQEKYRREIRSMVVSPGADRALRALLSRCRDRGIRPVLLLAPEAPSFRAAYDPAGWDRVEGYLKELAKEHGAPLIDARAWLEEDDFFDSHHPMRAGAEAFTRRLAKEVGFVFR
jgi:hypothetical protein